MSLVTEDTSKNYSTLRDSLATALATKLTPPPVTKARRRRRRKSQASDPAPADTAAEADLAEFTEYVAAETFGCLPPELKSLTHATWVSSARDAYALPLTAPDAEPLLRGLDPSVDESLRTYTARSAAEFLAPVLTSYLASFASPPPPPRALKASVDGCELCGRDWVRLSFHHLIPREAADKAVKRGWHRREDLEKGAWLCHACHGFVHSGCSRRRR
ncbi:hypothetical protein VUR80DRAFT_4964 [Thermomyces stellatus]